MKKIIVGLFILFMVIGIGFYFHSWIQATPNNTATQSLQAGKISQMVTATGDVEAEQQTNLTFLSAGRVASVSVKAGDTVQKGQTLAYLDGSIAYNQVAAAQAQYNSAQAALNKVIDDIHLKEAGGDPSKFSSIQETQTEKTQRQQAEEAVNAAYDNLQTAQEQAGLLSINAPFDGKVLTVQNITEGANVSPTSGSFITVIGGGDLKFVANIAEQDMNQIHLDQPAIITLDSTKGRVFAGTISNIANSKTVLSNGQSVMKVDIQSSDLQANATAGQTGNVTISFDQYGQQVVPSWTVVNNSVWVMENNHPILKKITVGQTTNGYTAITSGLTKEDQVIVNPEIIAKSKYTIL